MFKHPVEYNSEEDSPCHARVFDKRVSEQNLCKTFEKHQSHCCPFVSKYIHKPLYPQNKDGLISERFSIWLKSPQNVPNHSTEHLLFSWSQLAPIFGDLSQSEQLSEIKPPLACTY